MLVDNVKESISRLKKIQKQILQLQAQLNALKANHKEYWNELQNQCAETLHDLTIDEEIQTYKQYRDGKFSEILASKARWRRIEMECVNTPGHFQRKKEWARINPKSMKPHTGRLSPAFATTCLERILKHRCKYCLSMLEESKKTLKEDIYLRIYFDSWLEQDISSLPEEKKAMLEAARDEVEKYFKKAEKLQEKLKTLEQEKETLVESLETVWELCDKALGKDIERTRKEAEYVRELNETLGIPNRDDRYYWD